MSAINTSRDGADLLFVDHLPFKKSMSLTRSNDTCSVTIDIPMTHVREVIAELIRMADEHDAKSRQEKAA